MVVGNQSHSPASLPPGKGTDTDYTGFYVPLETSVPVWKTSPQRDWISGPSTSYRLSYPVIFKVLLTVHRDITV